MRQIIIITLILTSVTLRAQKLSEFFVTNDNLKKWYIPTDVVDINKALNSLKEDKTFDWVFYNLEQGSVSSTDFFHFLDFNNDGIRDMIYQGLLGGESQFVVLLKGNGTSFEKTIVLAGKIFWTNEPSIAEGLRFRLYNYACCMGRNYFIEYYSPKIRHDKFEFILENRETFIDETVFPTVKFKELIAFETINEEYNLRISPKIDNETDYWGHGEFGNDIATYPKGSTGIALAESTDDTGRVWWFVKMTNNIGNKGIFMDGDNNEEPYYSYGWVSSRYVNVLK